MCSPGRVTGRGTIQWGLGWGPLKQHGSHSCALCPSPALRTAGGGPLPTKAFKAPSARLCPLTTMSSRLRPGHPVSSLRYSAITHFCIFCVKSAVSLLPGAQGAGSLPYPAASRSPPHREQRSAGRTRPWPLFVRLQDPRAERKTPARGRPEPRSSDLLTSHLALTRHFCVPQFLHSSSVDNNSSHAVITAVHTQAPNGTKRPVSPCLL